MTDRGTSEPDDMEARAGEYVLGTLDFAERREIATRRHVDPRLDAAIRAWEQRLAPLNDLVPEVAPPREVWHRIEARLAGPARTQTRTQSRTMASATVVPEIALLQRRVKRWRLASVAAGALAASLLVAIGVREYDRAPTPDSFVAVFHKDDAVPAFLLSIDLAARRLSIQPVAAQAPAGKTYQLWIAPDASGKPRPLGLVDARGFSTGAVFDAYPAAIVQAATFGVSLEPAGGSPTGLPTGPVFHAKLIPTPR